MQAPGRPRLVLASFAASAAWLGPWIVLVLIISGNDNDDAVGYGLFVLFIPVILLLGALAWWIVGSILRGGARTLKQFMLRSALVMIGLALLPNFLGTLDAWEPVKWGEVIAMALMSGAALGLTALPAAAMWWHWAIRPVSGMNTGAVRT